MAKYCGGHDSPLSGTGHARRDRRAGRGRCAQTHARPHRRRTGHLPDPLAALPEQEYIDFAFIDADKPSYWTYYSELVPRMRAGGVIAVDNVLWSGRIVQDEPEEESTRLMKEFNDKVVRDERVDVVMLPVGDGVSLMYKR